MSERCSTSAQTLGRVLATRVQIEPAILAEVLRPWPEQPADPVQVSW